MTSQADGEEPSFRSAAAATAVLRPAAAALALSHPSLRQVARNRRCAAVHRRRARWVRLPERCARAWATCEGSVRERLAACCGGPAGRVRGAGRGCEQHARDYRVPPLRSRRPPRHIWRRRRRRRRWRAAGSPQRTNKPNHKQFISNHSSHAAPTAPFCALAATRCSCTAAPPFPHSSWLRLKSSWNGSSSPGPAAASHAHSQRPRKFSGALQAQLVVVIREDTAGSWTGATI